MTITDLEFYLVEISCDGRGRPLRSLLVRLATDARLEGWGEAAIAWRPSELAPRRDSLLPLLAGRSVFDIEELQSLADLDPPPLRAAVEMASWDLVSRSAGQPLCHLLGGRYRRRVPLAVRLHGRAEGEIVALSREMADRGFHTQVVCSSGDLEQDISQLLAVRETAGPRVQVRLDAASQYDMDTARALCRALEGENVEFVLDPLRGASLDETASLRRQTTIPLAVGRPLHKPADVLATVRCGAASQIVVDPARLGGLVPSRKSGAIAQAAGIDACVGGVHSLGIATAAVLQLAAATPAFSGASECCYHALQDDLLVERLEIIDGMITVPHGPGLGVDVDRAKLERYAVV